MKKALIAMGASMLLSGGVFAGSQIGPTRILYVGTYGNGNQFLQVEANPNEAGCTQSGSSFRVLIKKTNQNYNQILSIALSAYVSGTPVILKTNGCSSSGDDPSGIFPLLDESANSYILLNPVQ